MDPVSIFCHILYAVPTRGCPARRAGITRTRAAPGAGRIFLDNESVPLYTGTCPHVENQPRARLLLQHAVKQLLPHVENGVPGGEGVARSRSESEWRLALEAQ
jgi:hypothetical protein